MLAYFDLAGFGISVVAILLSAVSLLIHYGKRAEHPLTAPLQSQIDSIQLTQADIIDRVEHWMKRDRVRKLRDAQQGGEPLAIMDERQSELLRQQQQEALDQQAQQTPSQIKSRLRQVARTQGHKI
jgi:hypothetical protein